MSGTGRDTLPVVRDGWEAHLQVRDGSLSPCGGSDVVQIPNQRSGTGLEAFLEVLDGLEGPS